MIIYNTGKEYTVKLLVVDGKALGGDNGHGT
jgi:hypothetical protein